MGKIKVFFFVSQDVKTELRGKLNNPLSYVYISLLVSVTECTIETTFVGMYGSYGIFDSRKEVYHLFNVEIQKLLIKSIACIRLRLIDHIKFLKIIIEYILTLCLFKLYNRCHVIKEFITFLQFLFNSKLVYVLEIMGRVLAFRCFFVQIFLMSHEFFFGLLGLILVLSRAYFLFVGNFSVLDKRQDCLSGIECHHLPICLHDFLDIKDVLISVSIKHRFSSLVPQFYYLDFITYCATSVFDMSANFHRVVDWMLHPCQQKRPHQLLVAIY